MCAYARVGIDPDITFIAGAAPEACDGFAPPRAIFPDYRAHAAQLRRAAKEEVR